MLCGPPPANILTSPLLTLLLVPVGYSLLQSANGPVEVRRAASPPTPPARS